MRHYRYSRRLACGSAFRHAIHSATRTRWRAPDNLTIALACFRQAIRAHRRLARLAPRFFDSAVVERDRREQEARCRWTELCNAALVKVYGLASAPPSPPPVSRLPPLPRARTQLAVELELAACRTWLELGGIALRRFRIHHPHARVSFNRLAVLCELATALGQLAAGTCGPPTERDLYSNALADLQRIYGSPSET